MEEFQKKLRSRRRQYGKTSKYTRQQQALISAARDSLLSYTHKMTLPQLQSTSPSKSNTIASLYDLSKDHKLAKDDIKSITFSSTQPINYHNTAKYNTISSAENIISGVAHSSERPQGMPAIPPMLSTSLPLPSIKDDNDKQIWYIVMNTTVVSESGFKRTVRTPVGPLSVIHLRQLFASNEISLKTLFWREGFTKWSQLSQLSDLRIKLTNLPYIQQELPDLPEFDYEHIPSIPINTAPRDFYNSETLNFVDSSNAVELSKPELLYGVYQEVEPGIDKPCALCGDLSIVQLPCSIENEELDVEVDKEKSEGEIVKREEIMNDIDEDDEEFEFQYEKTLDLIHQIHRSEDQVGATEHCSEILNGFLWIGEQEAAKHRAIISLKLTMLINCTEELETPSPMPPYYRTNSIPFPRYLQPTELVDIVEEDGKNNALVPYEKTKRVKKLTDIEQKKYNFHILALLEEAYDFLEYARLFPDKLSNGDASTQTPFSETDSYGQPIKSRAENIYIRAYNQTHRNNNNLNKSTASSNNQSSLNKKKMSFLQSSSNLFNNSETSSPGDSTNRFFVQTPKSLSRLNSQSFLSSINNNEDSVGVKGGVEANGSISPSATDYQIMNPMFLKSFRMNSTASLGSNFSNPKSDVVTKPNTAASKIPLAKLTTSRILLYSEKGEDRPVLVAAAYLIKRFNISIKHAIKIINQKRPVSNLSYQSLEILKIWSMKYSSALNVKRAIKTMKEESSKVIKDLNNKENENIKLKSKAHYNMIRLCLDCKEQSIRSAQVKLKEILSNYNLKSDQELIKQQQLTCQVDSFQEPQSQNQSQNFSQTQDYQIQSLSPSSPFRPASSYNNDKQSTLLTYETDFSELDPRESELNNKKKSLKKKLLMMMIEKGGNPELFGIDKHGNYIEDNPSQLLRELIEKHLPTINDTENCDFSNLLDTKIYLKALKYNIFEYSKFANLIDLELSNRFLSDSTISYLFQLLGSINQIKKIRHLDLSYNSFGYLAMKSLLELSYPHVDPDDIFIMHNTLFINPDKDDDILNDKNELAFLNLAHTNINDHLAIKYLCFYIQNNNSLVSLNLFDNSIRDDLLGDLLSCLVTSTHSFDAHTRKNEFGQEKDNTITKILFNQSITTLNIGRNNILENATYYIKQVLKFNVVLTKLELDMAYGISPTSIKEICHAVKLYSRTIQEFTFNGINLSVKSMEFIARIHDSVTSSVKVLNMSDCKLFYLHLKTLCPILSYSHTLLELDLSSNPIGDRGAIAIASFLRGIGFSDDHEIISYEESKNISKNRSKKSKNNPFNGSKNYYSTKNSIVVNIPPLKRLDLNNCKLSPKGCAIIAYGLRDRTYNVAAAIEAKNNSNDTVRIYDKQSVEYSISLNDDTDISSHYQRLDFVDLSYNNIGPNNSIFYYAISESQVEDLQLNYCNLKTQGAIEILKYLKRNPGPSVNPPYDDYKSHYKKLLTKRNEILKMRYERRVEKKQAEEKEKERIKQATIAKFMAEEDEFYDKDDIALLGYSSEDLLKNLKKQQEEYQNLQEGPQNSNLEKIPEENKEEINEMKEKDDDSKEIKVNGDEAKSDSSNVSDSKSIDNKTNDDKKNDGKTNDDKTDSKGEEITSDEIKTTEENSNDVESDSKKTESIEKNGDKDKKEEEDKVKILESTDAFSLFLLEKNKKALESINNDELPKGIFNLLSKDINRIMKKNESTKASIEPEDEYDSDDFDEYCEDSEDDDEIDEFGYRLPILPSSALSEALRFLGLSGNEISNRCSKYLSKIIKNNYMIEQIDLGFNVLNDLAIPDLQESISIHSNSSLAKKAYELHINLLGNPFKKDYPLETPGKMRGKLQFGFGIAPNKKDPRREGYGHIASRTRSKFIKQKELDNKYRQLYPSKPISNII